MSVAVAVRKDGEIVIATDSLESFGSHVEDPQNLRIEKIIQIGPAYLAHLALKLRLLIISVGV